MKYTDEQKKIFDFVKNGQYNGIVDAVAGSGKTTTIIEAASFIPRNIKTLFCAFNKSIREEINRKFKENGQAYVIVKTMHAMGYDILKSNAQIQYQFSESKYASIIDNYIRYKPDHSLINILEFNDIPLKPKTKYEEINQIQDAALKQLNSIF